MKHKAFKWNYYILAFIVFVGLLVFIDLQLEGTVAEYFQREILFDREKVFPYGTMEYTRGTFHWLRLRDILKHIVVGGFISLEIGIYLAVRYARKKERTRLIAQLEERLSVLKKGEVPEKNEELRIIDAHINEIMRDKEIVKQEISLEMRKKNDLVTYLAHDLKTPLTSIIGYLTILEEADLPDEIRHDYIKKVLHKSYRMEDLTNQFFDIARFNIQEIPMNKSLLDARFFFEQLTGELWPLAAKKNLKIQLAIPDQMKIYVDGSLFARVMDNLLKNAIAYSHKDSAIDIKAKINEDNVQIFIENEGDVISEQELKLIFEKFYRRDQSRGQASGAGLGLAIAKEILQKHEGSLEAVSQQGHTTFIITLPKSL